MDDTPRRRSAHVLATTGLALAALLGGLATIGAAPASSAAARSACASESPPTTTSPRSASWYEPNPTYVDPRDDSADWRFALPESQSMDAGLLKAAGESLAPRPSILSFLVIRHGHLVYERYYHGSARNQSNNVHSASKSMLQALVNIAIEKGYIGSWDDLVMSYLPEDFAGASAAKKSMTIRDLMTMSSGLSWTEDRTEYTLQSQPDWVRAVLARRLRHAPGKRFNYSTGNTHVVSAILQRATGVKTSAFARKYLFDPLDITVEHWGHDPQGIDSGGYNVYMTPRELAKFALLYAQDGVWNGEQVVPASAVTQAATRTWKVDALFNYATGWWHRRLSGHDMFFAWGWGGQFVYVIPDLDVVMVTTENTADGQDPVEINSRILIQRYVIPSISRGFAVQVPRDAKAREGEAWSLAGKVIDLYGASRTATVDYREGARPETLALDAALGFTLARTWPDQCRRVISVAVTNDRGETTAATLAVRVVNVVPRIQAGGGTSLPAGTRFARVCSFTDPGADEWHGWVDYGDGTTRKALRLHADKTFSLSHFFPRRRGRRYTVTLCVTDDDGGRGTARFLVSGR